MLKLFFKAYLYIYFAFVIATFSRSINANDNLLRYYNARALALVRPEEKFSSLVFVMKAYLQMYKCMSL